MAEVEFQKLASRHMIEKKTQKFRAQQTNNLQPISPDVPTNSISITPSLYILPKPTTANKNCLCLTIEQQWDSTELWKDKNYYLKEVNFDFETMSATVLAGMPSADGTTISHVTSGWTISGSLSAAMSPSGTLGLEYTTSETHEKQTPTLSRTVQEDNRMGWSYSFGSYKEATHQTAISSQTRTQALLLQMTNPKPNQTLNFLVRVYLKYKQYSKLPLKGKSFTYCATFVWQAPVWWAPAAGFITMGHSKAGKSCFLNDLIQAVAMENHEASLRLFEEDVFVPTANLRVREVIPTALRHPWSGFTSAYRFIDTAGREWMQADDEAGKYQEEALLKRLIQGLPDGTDLSTPEGWQDAPFDTDNGIAHLVVVVNAMSLEKLRIIPPAGPSKAPVSVWGWLSSWKTSQSNVDSPAPAPVPSPPGSPSPAPDDTTAETIKETTDPDANGYRVEYTIDGKRIRELSRFTSWLKKAVKENNPHGKLIVVFTHLDKTYASRKQLAIAVSRFKGVDTGIVDSDIKWASKVCEWDDDLKNGITKHQRDKEQCMVKTCRHAFSENTKTDYESLMTMLLSQLK